MRVLLSGFAPYGEDHVNPSWEAVRRLDGIQAAENVTLFATRLPVVYGEAIKRLISSIRVIRPEVTIAVGQAGGRMQITPERVAINVSDAPIPDNAGRVLTDKVIISDGPAAYWSTLPVRKIVRAIKDLGIPAGLSNTAGTFVCNQVFYGLMHELSHSGQTKIGGFIHIPYIPEQTLDKLAPCLSLDTITKALKRAAVVSAEALMPEHKFTEIN
ncbi:pyrrolidone-carboxylate peptidase [Sporolactobacillus putidus]|uniref:Pyrrolidone-carboxylate peptidase n=2 Tax=Sporolactobacillus putidus TaxID=492735 RepID=A0A917RY95_9BACL|nr:pyrrolidone-carboxylate peptidase [Sporolactobacillus putidus]